MPCVDSTAFVSYYTAVVQQCCLEKCLPTQLSRLVVLPQHVHLRSISPTPNSETVKKRLTDKNDSMRVYFYSH